MQQEFFLPTTAAGLHVDVQEVASQEQPSDLLLTDLIGDLPMPEKRGRGKAKPGKAIKDYSHVVKAYTVTDMFEGTAHSREIARLTFADADEVQLTSDDVEYLGPQDQWASEHKLLMSAKYQDLFDRFVAGLHMLVLEDSLKVLMSEDIKPEVKENQLETLSWIFAQDWIGRIDDGQNFVRGTSAYRIAFSFVNCCHYYGVDPDELRNGLWQVDVVRDLFTENMPFYPLPPKSEKVSYDSIVRNALGAAAAAVKSGVNKVYQFVGM